MQKVCMGSESSLHLLNVDGGDPEDGHVNGGGDVYPILGVLEEVADAPNAYAEEVRESLSAGERNGYIAAVVGHTHKVREVALAQPRPEGLSEYLRTS